MTVVYLTRAGSTLAARSRTLVVSLGRETIARVPVLGVRNVVALAPTHFTSAALALCAHEGVEVVIVPRHAGVLARLGASESGLALRAAQHRCAEDPTFCLRVARAVVRGKVRNQRRLLGRSRGRHDPAVREARDELGAALGRVERAESPAALRGLEGRASAVYFRALRTLLNPEYGFRGRNRRPPRDPVNALLSFAYTLLTAETAAVVAGAGLEPALGFFHRARAGRPAMALDLVEEFRAPVADALVLAVTGLRRITPEHFRAGPAGVRMNASARRRFVAAYEEKLGQPFVARGGEALTLREALRAQALHLAEAVRGDRTYEAFELP
jgi:CRISPR-associated protein Cas1